MTNMRLFLISILFLIPLHIKAQTYIKQNSLIETPAVIVSAGSTTTLTNASQTNETVTGSSTQTIVLPDATTMPVGRSFLIQNKSTGIVTVNANGGGLVLAIAPGKQTKIVLRTNGSAAGVWDATQYIVNLADNTNSVSGLLPLANGGTNNNNTASAGALLYSDASKLLLSGVGTSGQAVVSGGTGAPTYFAPTAGSILYAAGSGVLAQDNSNLFWDGSAHRLGIGTTSPSSPLDIHVTSGVGLQSNNVGTQGSTAGALTQIGSDPGAAMASGSRLGQYSWFGSFDTSHTLSNSASIQGFATELWSGTSKGTKLTFNNTANTTAAQQLVLTLDQDKSATFTGAVNASSLSLTSPLPLSSGGLGIASGTSGGIPYFSSTSTVASSGLLTNHAIVLGGGAAASPVSLGSLGTSTTVLHGAAAGDPSFGAVSLTADVSGALPLLNGGTGTAAASANAAFNALSPMTTGGDLIYGGASGVATRLANGSANTILVSGGGTAAPAWSTMTRLSTATAPCALVVNASNTEVCTTAGTGSRFLRTSGTTISFQQVILSSDVTGTLPVANGGTGLTTYTAPTIQTFTTGSGTYTKPAGVKWIRVKIVGAGGGGGGSGTASSSSNGAAGTASTFDTLSAGGGTGATWNGNAGAGGAVSVGAGWSDCGSASGNGGGAWSGGIASSNIFAGGFGAPSALGGSPAGGNYSTAGSSASANTGAGGGGGGTNNVNSSVPGAGGGSGGFVCAINTAVATSYSYSVGGGGAGGSAGTSGLAGGNGASGLISVEEHYW